MIAPLSLPPETVAAVDRLAGADFVVGIPSAEGTGRGACLETAVRSALERHFRTRRAVVISPGWGGSPPEEPGVDAAGAQPLLRVAYPVYPVHKLSLPYHGMPGRGTAFRTIFEVARRLGARACAVVDAPDALAPDSLRTLLSPILDGDFDLVAPCYMRRKYDGTITKGIVYPLTRALYGRRLRQILGREFAFSARLMADCLGRDLWSSDIGIDISLATNALAGGYRTCQARLCEPAGHGREAITDLSTVLVQVVGSVFGEMSRHAAAWQKVRGSQDVPSFGDCRVAAETDEDVAVRPMLEAFHLGVDALAGLWSVFVSPAAVIELRKLARMSEPGFRMPDALWVRIVHDFALGYRQRLIPRDQILQALTPLYLGWLASLVLETRDAAAEAVEERTERLCLVFETHKGELISRWRWPDRFNP